MINDQFEIPRSTKTLKSRDCWILMRRKHKVVKRKKLRELGAPIKDGTTKTEKKINSTVNKHTKIIHTTNTVNTQKL